MQFIHKVSKGSRFNQIYIPRGMESIFEAGDLVEVKLIKKKVELFYSRKIEINEFKNKLIREIISFLSRFKDIKQIFMVGSFLTKKIDYNDLWIQAGSLSSEKKYLNFGIGLIDAAIIVFARKNNLKIWSLDKKLLSRLEEVEIYRGISGKKTTG